MAEPEPKSEFPIRLKSAETRFCAGQRMLREMSDPKGNKSFSFLFYSYFHRLLSLRPFTNVENINVNYSNDNYAIGKTT
jgi:hypothetical protein